MECRVGSYAQLQITMRILLIGYGKMGKTIESLISPSQNEVAGIIQSSNKNLLREKLQLADVAIEFTTPASALSNIKACIEENVAVVVGTTGWYDQLAEAKKFCLEKNGSLVYASNFSIGVNLFFMLNSQLAQLMKSHKDYKTRIEETHHVQKKDAPSGTAIILANDLERITGSKVEIQSKREGDVVGEHTVFYEGSDDIISIQHKAITRASFAKGALAAAEWIIKHKGFFNFRDIVTEL